MLCVLTCKSRKAFNPIPGGGWCKFASPSIFSSTLSRRKYALLKTFWLLIYFRWLRSKFIAIFGWGVAQRIQIFYSKSLITEYAIKSKDMLRFASNFNTTPILIVAIYWKSWFSKIFKFRPPSPPLSNGLTHRPLSPAFLPHSKFCQNILIRIG